MTTPLALLGLLLSLVAQPSLRIVVIEGEGAVNIIQQKTAVAPIVEVRDQNNLPVGGATVTFTIQGGKSAVFAGGSQTMTVTTNAAGRAVAAAVNPLGSGTVQIQTAAAFQGQTVTATITQTNVMTAAQAGASTASAGGAGGGSGGGLGGGAIAGIAGGAAAAAGALVLTQKEEDGGGDVNQAPPPGGQTQTSTIDPAIQAASGTYTLQTINGAGLPAISVTSPPATCRVATDNATLTLNVNRNYEVIENSRTECPIGPSSTFRGVFNGSWSISGSTINFSTGAPAGQFTFDSGTLNGSTLSVAFQPPHIDAGRVADRVNSTWRK
jgi:hypothetical protein